MSYWLGKTVLVTGGAGFIGRAVVRALEARKVRRVVVPRSTTCDLRDPANCRLAVDGCDVVLHLAAPTGGIAFSRAHPASQYRDCTLINANLLEACHQARVGKLVCLGNLLAYPADAPSPLEEASLFDGRVAETHRGIGLAKRDLVEMGEMYHREFGLEVVNVLAANAYGPGDRFDPTTSHVIPATILKCHASGDIVVWGDGTPTRDFLYVDDVAAGILLAAERLPAPQYVNVASGREVSIAELVRLIASLCDFGGKIVFDSTKGGGDPRRVASIAQARNALGFEPATPIEEGLRRTIAWYRERAPS
jgi:GDP-L-fucose synthase